MKIRNICSSLILTGVLCYKHLICMETAHWGYSGPEGPEHWGRIRSSKYAICSSGKNQSPINLTGIIESDLSPISHQLSDRWKRNSEQWPCNSSQLLTGSSISVSGRTFNLKQFHFHSPSENTIEKQSFPMEAHFVHADSDGNLAVIAVMYTKKATKMSNLKKLGLRCRRKRMRKLLSLKILMRISFFPTITIIIVSTAP